MNMNKNELNKQLASTEKTAEVAQPDKNEQKLNERQKKIVDFLLEKEGYEKTNKENILRKYRMDDTELVFETSQEGKLDFEVEETNIDLAERVIFTIRVDKFIEREFKKFYQNADEVKRVLENQKEKYFSQLSELGFKDYFKYHVIRLFSNNQQLADTALKMANGEIDIDDYSDGRSKQIEVALAGSRFEEVKQSNFANYQEYTDYLKDLRVKKEKLVGLQRAIEKDWRELKDRHWSGMWDWLRTDERKKEAKRLFKEGQKTKESLGKKWAEEYFNSLPKTTQVKYENVEKSVINKIADWEGEIVREEKKTWTDEQWKQYRPDIKYDGESYQSRSYNEGRAGKLQLEKINGKGHRWGQYANHFYQEVVNQQKESFESSHDSCWHCLEAGTKSTFKLVLKTKWRLIYVCSRCENTEYFFDIAEWKEGKNGN
jgi:hypothetical protein